LADCVGVQFKGRMVTTVPSTLVPSVDKIRPAITALPVWLPVPVEGSEEHEATIATANAKWSLVFMIPTPA
jgi:hypothetical protein